MAFLWLKLWLGGAMARNAFYGELESIGDGNISEARNFCSWVLQRWPRDYVLVSAGELAGRMNDLAAAEECFQKALATNPQCREARYGLGNVCLEAGRYQGAVDHFQAALSIDENHSLIWVGLARAQSKLGTEILALRALNRALALNPNSVPAGLLKAEIAEASGRDDQAVSVYERLLQIKVNDRSIMERYCCALGRQGRWRYGLKQVEASSAFENQDANYWGLMSYLHILGNQYQEALSLSLRGLALRSDDFQQLANHGTILRQLARWQEAIEWYDKALLVRPNDSAVILNKSICLLALGRFAEGWPLYAQRVYVDKVLYRQFDKPCWDGRRLMDEGLFLYWEQGIGDQIMFLCCLPEVQRRVPNCVVNCSPKLEGILRSSFPDLKLIPSELDYSSAQTELYRNCAYALPFGDLPRVLGMAEPPKPDCGYLRSEPNLQAEVRARLAGLGSQPKIGISWRGGTEQTHRRLRSLDLNQLKGLLSNDGCHFINLQYDTSAEEVSQIQQKALGFHHWPELLENYEATAALVSCLDLVISVQTAIIHLGGALGRPVWVMIPASPEWRYGAEGTQMAWYSSVHLYRQKELFKWEPVLENIQKDLVRFLGHYDDNSEESL